MEKEKEQQDSTQQNTQVESFKPQNIHHFNHEIPLPETATVQKYQPKPIKKNKPNNNKNKKFKFFRYYRDPITQQLHKILFLNNEQYVDQGCYPFTDPTGAVKTFQELHNKNVQRVNITEAAYIGHFEGRLIIKKMQGVKLGKKGEDFETVNDQFEYIPIANEERYKQFMKLMGMNKNSINMSIRVIVEESEKEGQGPHVLDYEFFLREEEINKKHNPKSEQSK